MASIRINNHGTATWAELQEAGARLSEGAAVDFTRFRFGPARIEEVPRGPGIYRFLGEDVDSTGSTLVNVTPGLRFRTAAGSFLYALVQVPVHQDVNEDQLAPRFGIVAGVSRSF